MSNDETFTRPQWGDFPNNRQFNELKNIVDELKKEISEVRKSLEEIKSLVKVGALK